MHTYTYATLKLRKIRLVDKTTRTLISKTPYPALHFQTPHPLHPTTQVHTHTYSPVYSNRASSNHLHLLPYLSLSLSLPPLSVFISRARAPALTVSPLHRAPERPSDGSCVDRRLSFPSLARPLVTRIYIGLCYHRRRRQRGGLHPRIHIYTYVPAAAAGVVNPFEREKERGWSEGG